MGSITSRGGGVGSPAAPNTIVVGAGKTIQDAITAAVAAGADKDNPWVVEYGPTALPVWTDAPGVTVKPITDLGPYPATERLGGNERIGEHYPVPYNMPLVSIVCDDTDALWFGVPDGAPFGAGVSPFEYFWKNGIPIAHALCSKMLNVPGKMSTWQLLACFYYNGSEILCHSANHASGPNSAPSSAEDVWKETGGARAWAERLTINDADNTAMKAGFNGISPKYFGSTVASPDQTPWYDVGWNVRGFVKPGTWTVTGSNIDTNAVRQTHPVWEAVRTHFEYACTDTLYGLGGIRSAQHRRHEIVRQYLRDGVEPGAANLIDPNTRTVLLMHAFADEQWANVKTAVDRLVAARNAGLLQLVSPKTIVYGIPAGVPSGVWGGVKQGSFTGMSALSDPWGGEGTIVTGDLGECVELGHAVQAYSNVQLPPGQYMLRFKQKATHSTGNVVVDTTPGYIKHAGNARENFTVKRLIAAPNTSTLKADPYESPHPIYVPFSVPNWSQVLMLSFVYANSVDPDATCQIDDVEIARI